MAAVRAVRMIFSGAKASRKAFALTTVEAARPAFYDGYVMRQRSGLLIRRQALRSAQGEDRPRQLLIVVAAGPRLFTQGLQGSFQARPAQGAIAGDEARCILTGG